MTTTKKFAVIDQELIQRARQATGENSGTSLPFMPIVKVNNKNEIRVIDGETLKANPKKGFLITKKDENDNYANDWFGDELNGVILKPRWRIKSKWTEDNAVNFFSYEFDNFYQQIKIFNKIKGQKQQVIAQGTYKDLCKQFQTEEKNAMGQFKKSFSLFAILYTSIKDGADIIRFEHKIIKDDSWFAYQNSFGPNQTILGCKTNFELMFNETGQIKFWTVQFVKGEPVKIIDYLDQLEKINEGLTAIEQQYNQPKQTQLIQQPTIPILTIEDFNPESEVDVSSIPF